MRWNLKEAVGKPLVRRTEIAYKARLLEISWLEATKSNNYLISPGTGNDAWNPWWIIVIGNMVIVIGLGVFLEAKKKEDTES